MNMTSWQQSFGQLAAYSSQSWQSCRVDSAQFIDDSGQVMEEYKRKNSEVSERLMKRNRPYQKLQVLNDLLRLRNMVVGDRDTMPARTHRVQHRGDQKALPPEESSIIGHEPKGDMRLFSLEPRPPARDRGRIQK